MKKIITGLMIGILLFSLTACKKEETKTDASRFKEEYESLNGTKNSSGKTIREIEIEEDNPMIYQSTKDILKKMEDKETFVVYFGFAECPWCRSMLEQFLKSAKDNGIDSIYYVDVQEIRDTYQINDNGEGFSDKALKEATHIYFKENNEKNHFGLGLYISKLLAEKHNGNIILSNTDSGARVKFSFSYIY